MEDKQRHREQYDTEGKFWKRIPEPYQIQMRCKSQLEVSSAKDWTRDLSWILIHQAAGKASPSGTLTAASGNITHFLPQDVEIGETLLASLRFQWLSFYPLFSLFQGLVSVIGRTNTCLRSIRNKTVVYVPITVVVQFENPLGADSSSNSVWA